MHLVMFDIDGTLVDSNHFDGALYSQAVTEILGVSLDTTWSSYTNVTDTGILQEIAIEAGRETESFEIQSSVKLRFLELFEDYIAVDPSAIREISGASSLIRKLRAIPHVQLAIATGGWRESAFRKLQAIGLDPEDLAIATASDAMARTKIMQLAEDRAATARTFTRKTYFGDGLWDQKASKLLGYEFIAVGKKVPHHTVFHDLRDHQKILERLGVHQL